MEFKKSNYKAIILRNAILRSKTSAIFGGFCRAQVSPDNQYSDIDIICTDIGKLMTELVRRSYVVTLTYPTISSRHYNNAIVTHALVAMINDIKVDILAPVEAVLSWQLFMKEFYSTVDFTCNGLYQVPNQILQMPGNTTGLDDAKNRRIVVANAPVSSIQASKIMDRKAKLMKRGWTDVPAALQTNEYVVGWNQALFHLHSTGRISFDERMKLNK